MGRFVRVAAATTLVNNAGVCVEVEGKRIALFRSGDEIFAIDDACTHRGGPLSEGDLVGEVVTCPWHGATFDLRTGETQGGPAPSEVDRYAVRITGDDVEVEI